MSFRDYISVLEKQGKLVRIKKPVSRDFEAAGILKALDGKPVLFEKIKESSFPVMGNYAGNRELVCGGLGCNSSELVQKVMHAIDHPSEPKEFPGKPPCQEVVEENVDLSKLPILRHCSKDGGPYLSSAVVFAKDKELGRNVSFHRMMVAGKNRLVLRILQRHLDAFIKRNGGELDVAVCVGLPVNVLLAAATSVELGMDELGIANTLGKVETTDKTLCGVGIPAEAELVIEGRITKELAPEGPFVDLTETYDIVREQPIMEVKRITHRRDMIYHALLPGALEHKMLMGTPREPTIFREVNKVCECLDVSITPGGCSWLHAFVKIRKKSNEDGKKALEAAFKGHGSLKHCAVFDEDIDINNPLEVEWAMATRYQAGREVVKLREKGSSLDPSADPKTRETNKVGLDCTAPYPLGGKYVRADFPKVDLEKFL